jgi:hypothetical protein
MQNMLQDRRCMGHASRKVKIMQQEKRRDRTRNGIYIKPNWWVIEQDRRWLMLQDRGWVSLQGRYRLCSKTRGGTGQETRSISNQVKNY